MKLNWKSALIHQSDTITYNSWGSNAHWLKGYFSLSGVRQGGRVHWCSKKYGELCRCVFEFVKLNMYKKLNVADIF